MIVLVQLYLLSSPFVLKQKRLYHALTAKLQRTNISVQQNVPDSELQKIAVSRTDALVFLLAVQYDHAIGHAT
jgi:hypothetical protein